ncbi:MAG TPA: methyltransferase domain-containing protein [Micromonosporaceae bacterium]|jgi:O-methyltransferase/aklanonic acid methyltransferase|nr:methyltransferase domain-containing protein [Micromonosporaceae bacterium]
MDGHYIAELFDRAAGTFDTVPFFGPVGVELVRLSGAQPGDRVLDVGCGRGASLFPAADAVGPSGEVVGIDLAPAMVAATVAEIARRRLTNARAYLGDAAAPTGGPYDLVLAGFLLFFLDDPNAAVRAYADVLRPGGRLAVSLLAEATDEEQTLLRAVARALAPYTPADGVVPGDAPFTERLQSRAALGELLAGFADVRFSETVFELAFSEPGQVWDWLWSAGRRAALERIPPDRLDEARAAVRAIVPGGAWRLPRRVRFATAVKDG